MAACTVRAAVVGAGRLGRAVERALVQRGVGVRLFSRATGFDIRHAADAQRLGPAEVVVEATDIFTQKADVARDFFVQSTRAVSAAGRGAGARKHILVSIVNCEQPALQGSGYYAAKAEQERVAHCENDNMIIVRSTLWHEFARQNLDRFRVGPLAMVPTMTVQPVALDAVAAVVADCAVGDRRDTRYDITGPEITTLWNMTKALPKKRALPVPVRIPGATGRAMRDGALLPSAKVEVVGPDYTTWLTQHPE